MLVSMSEQRHQRVGDGRVRLVSAGARRLTISCDECALQCTAACADCVVTFVLRADDRAVAARDHDVQEGLVLDCDQARVVRLLGAAGLVPELKYQVTA
jgi:hypothetical protein